mgnify:FL=1
MKLITIRKCNKLEILLIHVVILVCLFIMNLDLNSSKSSCTLKRESMELFDNFEKLNKLEFPLCNKRSRKYGYHQKVISTSAYQSDQDNKLLTRKILEYALQYINESKYLYPNWRVRIYYHNLPITNKRILDIEERYENVDFCNALDIPFLGDITAFMAGRLHRFVAFADPFVDTFMSRDLDSPILKREVIAVDEWLSSSKLFHIMRDHQLHHDVMLAGLWGGKISQNDTIRKMLTQFLFSKPLIKCYDPIDGDLHFLQHFVWPLAQTDSIQHDSFHCQNYSSSIPFAQPKLSMSQFIGCRRPCRLNQDPPELCPQQCLYPKRIDTVLC